MKKLFGGGKSKLSRPRETGAETNAGDTQAVPPIYAAHTQTQHLRPRNGSAAHEHHLSSDDEPWQHVPNFDSQNAPPPPITGTASRSSSLASVATQQLQQPPQQQPQPASLSSLPRTSSPFAGAPPAPHGTTRSAHLSPERDKDHSTAKRSGGGAAAVSILKALDPQFEPPKVTRTDESRSQTEEDHSVHSVQHSQADLNAGREERRERKGFWDRAAERREERREQKERAEQNQDELTRLIGYLTATSSEDFVALLDCCEKASANESNAKEAAKALRREFKYGDVPQQLSAARLWAIMLRNASEVFVHQCMSRKFLDALEDTIMKNTTSPVVKERLLDVLAAAAFASQPHGKEGKQDGFRTLWRKLKPPGKPDEGYPFDYDDAMFYPPNTRRRSAIGNNTPPALHPQTQQSPNVPSKDPFGTQKLKKDKNSSRNKIIPPEEDIRRLFQECKFAHGNAQLLSEALAFARPEDLNTNVIREFHEKCKNSQELILAQIPWASAGADRSRQRRLAQNELKPQRPRSGPTRPESPVELTTEEQLLAALLEANETLLSVLRVYDDVERIGQERETEERSKHEVRIDRSKLIYDEKDGSVHLEPPAREGGGSSSRSPSPSPSPLPSPSLAPIPSVLMPAVHQNPSHPLPVPPGQLVPGSGGPVIGLAPPPLAPQGPRSPGVNSLRARTPSPEHQFSYTTPGEYVSGGGTTAASVTAPPPAIAPVAPQRINIIPVSSYRPNEQDDDSEEAITPVKPSAKALGKRPMEPAGETDDSFNPDDMFYERMDPRNENRARADESVESDEDGADSRWPKHHRPQVNYAYDAVAERTQQLMREHGQLTTANGVH